MRALKSGRVTPKGKAGMTRKLTPLADFLLRYVLNTKSSFVNSASQTRSAPVRETRSSDPGLLADLPAICACRNVACRLAMLLQACPPQAVQQLSRSCLQGRILVLLFLVVLVDTMEVPLLAE